MSSLADAIVVGDSSDDEGPKPPPASSPEDAIEIPDSSDDEGPPPRKKLCGPDRQAVAASAPSPDERTIAEVSPVDDQPTIAPAPSPAKKRRPYKCGKCGELKKTGCKCFAASIISSTTERCTIPKCTAGSCTRLHQCRKAGRGCRSGRQWLAPEAFDTKKGGEKRNLTCIVCAAKQKGNNAISNAIWNPINNPINNPITNAKTAAKKMQERIAYEKATLGDEHDVSPEALRAHREAAISRAEELIAGYDVTCPEGYAVIFYGASTGSKGFSVKEEGVNQFRPRGYKVPTIIDAQGHVPPAALTGAWGPGGKSVYDCGSSKVISHAVEKALHEHFAPICDASDDKMPRLWRKRGAGYAQGIGPYHVCIRIMPLPLPHGWRRSF